jgi:hypothetical protein
VEIRQSDPTSQTNSRRIHHDGLLESQRWTAAIGNLEKRQLDRQHDRTAEYGENRLRQTIISPMFDAENGMSEQEGIAGGNQRSVGAGIRARTTPDQK